MFQGDKTKTWRNYVIIFQISISGYSFKHDEDFGLNILSPYPLKALFKNIYLRTEAYSITKCF